MGLLTLVRELFFFRLYLFILDDLLLILSTIAKIITLYEGTNENFDEICVNLFYTSAENHSLCELKNFLKSPMTFHSSHYIQHQFDFYSQRNFYSIELDTACLRIYNVVLETIFTKGLLHRLRWNTNRTKNTILV